MIFPIVLLPLALIQSVRAAYTATYTVGQLPEKSEQGQIGTNNCGTGSNQTALCQTIFVNSVNDFCLWGPSSPNAGNIGDIEEEVVGYCLLSGYGTRLFPDGTIQGAHFIKTPDFVQVTGWGDFTKIGVKKGDAGGELDPHGATGFGNPIGGLVFGDSFGRMKQYHEWTNFMSSTEFCIRACDPAGPNARRYCQHIYDVTGCEWNMPGNYDQGYFDTCLADSGEPMGVYGSSTFRQGQPVTPAPHPKPSSSDCVRVASVKSGNATPTAAAVTLSTVYQTVSTGSTVVVYAGSVVALDVVQTGVSATASSTKATVISSSSSSWKLNTTFFMCMLVSCMGVVAGALVIP